MKKTGLLVRLLILASAAFLLQAGVMAAYSHEVWIEVSEAVVNEKVELRAVVSWGHFGDQTDPADPADYRLFVRRPDGEESVVELTGSEDSLRGSLEPVGKGEYIFTAIREPSIYSPAGGPATLSVQTAKKAYLYPEKGRAADPSGVAFEIIPKQDIRRFKGEIFEGMVVLEGGPVAGAVVQVIGSDGHTAEKDVTDSDGRFAVDITRSGRWLLKANLRSEKPGKLEGAAYGATSHTATLLLDLGDDEMEVAHRDGHAHDHGHAHTHAHDRQGTAVHEPAPWEGRLSTAVVFVAGLLVGGAGVLAFAGWKRNNRSAA